MNNFLYKNPKQSAYSIILLLAFFSTLYNSFIPLHGDEAYYWMWSYHLQSGYYDHPPMIAYLIYLTNFISESEWGVRLVNVFSFSIAALYIFKLTSDMFDEQTALNAVIIFSSVILVHAGYIITTPDSPLILFWTLSLYYSYKALFYGKWSHYILAGFMLGFMMISKYTSILLITSILFFILLRKRDILFNIKFYTAVFIAIIVVLPMLLWNYQHDWISFNFQLDHGSSNTYEISLSSAIEYIGGQFVVFSPLFAALLFFFLVKDKLYFKENKLFFLVLATLVTLLFFLYKSLFKPMALNYAAPAYVSAVILLAYIISKHQLQKSFKIGLIIAIVLTLIGRFGILFYLEIFQDRMYGNKEAVALVQKYSRQGDAFYGDHLTTAALLQYYLPGHPESDLATGSRFSQYDMWRENKYLKDGLVLTRDPEETSLKQKYKDVELLETLEVKKGINGTKTFYIYRVKTAF
ncbi:MAG: glycosyltransferase family 39 protein [Sulfurimonas sp.]|nr:glycosyltransferase family 39 protein [Sulfurimonas sp.]MBU3939685.1 glycosyltransferase family 39 protein [bacterium]MBU4024064.1 glycosyltransferase family 39 protein [bacterium]MBU4059966.1 glycosyltransferase family 39 protein [bacterium]MBU4111460.1 glycosyltransferase family 39 protein [bacterium]